MLWLCDPFSTVYVSPEVSGLAYLFGILTYLSGGSAGISFSKSGGIRAPPPHDAFLASSISFFVGGFWLSMLIFTRPARQPSILYLPRMMNAETASRRPTSLRKVIRP